jgi:hypothetical protein
MSEPYELLHAIRLTHCEVLVSVLHRKGESYLSVAPRKSFVDAKTSELVMFIPKRSSIEFDSAEELDAFIEALLRSREVVFGNWQRRPL